MRSCTMSTMALLAALALTPTVVLAADVAPATKPSEAKIATTAPSITPAAQAELDKIKEAYA